MKRLEATVLQGMSKAIPLPAYQVFIRRETIGVFYHMVADRPVPHVRHLYPFRPVEIFEQDLIYLKRKHHLLSYDDLWERRKQGRALPKNSVFLSFDDGFAECFHVVRPLLLKHDIPCIFFVTTDFIDNVDMCFRNKASLCIEQVHALQESQSGEMVGVFNETFQLSLADRKALTAWIKAQPDEAKINQACDILNVDVKSYLDAHQPFLTRDQIQTMAAEGFAMGAHTRRHRKLSYLNPLEIEDEIAGSCQVMHDLTGKENIPFSFPNSGHGLDRNLLKKILSDHPHVGLLFDTKGLKKDQDFVLNRIWAESVKLSAKGRAPVEDILRKAYQAQFEEAIRSGRRRMTLREELASETGL